MYITVFNNVILCESNVNCLPIRYSSNKKTFKNVDFFFFPLSQIVPGDLILDTEKLNLQDKW